MRRRFPLFLARLPTGASSEPCFPSAPHPGGGLPIKVLSNIRRRSSGELISGTPLASTCTGDCNPNGAHRDAAVISLGRRCPGLFELLIRPISLLASLSPVQSRSLARETTLDRRRRRTPEALCGSALRGFDYYYYFFFFATATSALFFLCPSRSYSLFRL